MSYTANIACQQFGIVGAGETIQAVSQLSDVFSPPHHGPRDIPISVKLSPGDNYVHFPIVRTGRYAIYLDTSHIFKGMIYSGINQNTGTGTPIATGPIRIGGCKDFAEGFVSIGDIIFTNDDPQPIAIHLSNPGASEITIKYIVSLFQG
ncbi:MAG: hypothetical protein J7647_09035 [Cyanobacteria bacterium SBLK]|nr:hypothetical protein [Cyanobacteria bacterium SBLK]